MKNEIKQLYIEFKPLLFSLSYRMLGNVMDAEDIVHEAILSLGSYPDLNNIHNPKAYLCKTVTNLCMNYFKSSSYQRETYYVEWLPEPVDTKTIAFDPHGSWLLKETLSTAYLLLLDRLTYVERAVFLLREVFSFGYKDIADMVDKSEPNCRKIYSRAKVKMNAISGDERRPSSETASDAKKYDRVLERFVQALKEGDVHATLGLLKDDALLLADGGGKVNTVDHPMVGGAAIAEFLHQLEKRTRALDSIRFAEINGYPGLIVYDDAMEKPSHVVSFHYSGDKIDAVYMMANPDKLRHFYNK